MGARKVVGGDEQLDGARRSGVGAPGEPFALELLDHSVDRWCDLEKGASAGRRLWIFE